MTIRRSIAGLAIALAPTFSFGWGHQGHEYIGAIADQLLSKNAAAQVQKHVGFTLMIAARWADCVKDVRGLKDGTFRYIPVPKYHVPCEPFETKEGIAQMEDYVARNWRKCDPKHVSSKCHSQYHFADIPIQHGAYSPQYAGAFAYDVTNALNASIAKLQNRPVPAPFSIKDEAEAIFLLAHFIGDLHQPLHVGSVYLDTNGTLVLPAGPGHNFDPNTFTRGGNWIFVAAKRNLHSEWDNIGNLDSLKISAASLKNAQAIYKATPTIAFEGWIVSWASETVGLAQNAFDGITFNKVGPKNWTAQFADRKKYLAEENRLTLHQLEKGGARLAQVLNYIWPDRQ